MEPPVGFEPTTRCLQNSYSTPELQRRSELLRSEFARNFLEQLQHKGFAANIIRPVDAFKTSKPVLGKECLKKLCPILNNVVENGAAQAGE